MTLLAPHLTAFFRDSLPRQRNVSPHTSNAYAYAFCLLLAFASRRHRVQPADLTLSQLDASLVLDFLNDLEVTRKNSARTRNSRLAAIKSFARFVQHRVPSSVEQVHRLLAIPTKKTDEKLVAYLTREEMQSVLDAPDPRSRDGLRDRALLHLAVACGLRVSELVGLQLDDLTFRPQPSVHIIGKGRRERILPLWKTTTKALQAWIAVRERSVCTALFLSSRGSPLTRNGFAYILAKHVATATDRVPSLRVKHVSPHVLRHTCAIQTLEATHDIRRVALWLGHASVQTTEIYLRVDPATKLEAIDAVLPPKLRRGRFQVPDKLIEALNPSRRAHDYAQPSSLNSQRNPHGDENGHEHDG